MATDLSPEQAEALERAEAYLSAKHVSQPYFGIQGLGGTGKSFLLAELARRRQSALLCAPTGKAASVLARRTGLEAKTIHSAIYLFRGEFIDETTGRRELVFKQKVSQDAWRRRQALIDESSMVDGMLGSDLLATGARIIATGDPGQLQPVRGTRFFDRADVTLRRIHRQALDSAIIRQAYRVRGGEPYRQDGLDFRVVEEVSREDILQAEVVLCWRNATRHILNNLMRAHRNLNGPPRAGEPILCLKNDHDLGVLNGAQYELLNDYDSRHRLITLKNERGHVVDIPDCRFETIDPATNPADVEDEHPFAFGYVLTVHKAQGSEWTRGIVVDEYDRMEQRREWLYTAFTRFSKSVIIRQMI